MTTLSPQQRIAAYEWAAERIKENPGSPFICNSLSDWLEKNSIFFNEDDILQVFPEFKNHWPEGIPFGSAWWRNDEEGNKQRLEVLGSCILMAGGTL